jgi:hypothetical protein
MTGALSLVETIDDITSRWTTSVTYSVGTNTEYAIYVEFGTSKMAAQPYLRPAAEQARNEIPAIVAASDSLEKAVQRVALRVEDIARRLVPVDTGNLRSSIAAQEV